MNIPHPHVHLGLPLHAPRVLSSMTSWLKRFVGAERYRPERYYMRGPGPKTLAKLGRERDNRFD